MHACMHVCVRVDTPLREWVEVPLGMCCLQLVDDVNQQSLEHL